MSIRNSFTLGMISLTLLAGACHHTQNESTTADRPLDVVPPIIAQSGATPSDNSDTAAALAAHTSQYAHEVSPLLNKGADAKPGAAPSVVKWVDPADAPKSATTPDAPPASKAVSNAAMTASTPAPAAPAPKAAPAPTSPAAVLASARLKEDSGDPLILPASADHLSDPAAPAVTVPSDEFEKKLQQQIHDYPRDLGNQLAYQLLRFARDESTPEASSLAPLPGEDREIISALMDGLGNFRNATRADGNLLLSKKIQPFLDMADRLRSQAELTIPTFTLCTGVTSFGVYTPLASPRLIAGRENPIIPYCEVGNFTSVQTDDKMWETRLQIELVLYSQTGMQVWPAKANAQTVVDHSRNRRHDFYVGEKLRLPATLTIGSYLLKVTMTDLQSNRVSEATTPIEIVAQ